MWQDWILMITGFGFTLALIPAVRRPPSKMACLLTAVLLLINGIAVATLELWLAFSATMLNCCMWTLLLTKSRR